MPSKLSRAIGGTSSRRSVQAMSILALCLLLLPAGMLSGCGGTAVSVAADAHATLPAGTQATQTVQPVSVAVAVTQRGTLAARNLQLALTVTITNRTSQSIAITNLGCPSPTLVIELHDAAGTKLWQNYALYINCPLFATLPRDVWAIAAGASLSQTVTMDLFVPSTSSRWVGSATPDALRAGVPYTVVAEVLLWHQGNLSDIDRSGVPQGRNVTGQATIVFT
jgi:hypothetical protein